MRGTNPSRATPTPYARVVSTLRRLTTATRWKVLSAPKVGANTSARQGEVSRKWPGTSDVNFSEAQKLVEEIWSHLSKSEQLRLLDFFSAPKAEVIRAKRELIFRSKKDGPGSDSDKKVTMAVSAGRLGK